MKIISELRKWTHSIHFFFTLITMMEITLAVLAAAILDEFIQNVMMIHVIIPSVLWLPLMSLIIGALLAMIMNYIFFKPVTRLGKAMNKVAKGEFGETLETESRVTEINDLYSSFNMMTKELANTEMLQSDFVSNVSHEFKTPINAIEGYATLLQDGTLTDNEKNEYVDKILHNTRRVSDLVGNILLLSKIDNQTIRSKECAYRLDEQIRQSILLLEPKWTERDIEFYVDLDEIEYIGNESMIQHVWTNLIDNAIKFSPTGGTVAIKMLVKSETIVVSVVDHGVGIPEEKLHHIFDKFYQVDSSHKDEGNGLGLALVKQILGVNGDTVAVENNGDGGCTFTVTLKRKH